MYKKLLACAASFFLFAACAPQNSEELYLKGEQGVMGGERVPEGHSIAQSIVGLYDPEFDSVCTGILIAPELVLTAAHCVKYASTELQVVFHRDLEVAKKDFSLRRRILKAVYHEDYYRENAEDRKDIAVVRIKGRLPVGYVPVTLLQDFSAIRDGSRVFVAGYGLSKVWPSEEGSGLLRFTDLEVSDSHFNKNEIKLNQSSKKGVCSGDSGGPAFIVKDQMIHILGVTSRGDKSKNPLTPRCKKYSIFTRIDGYQDWIKETSEYLMSLK